MSPPRHHAGALRGVLVGAVSALLTAVAHAAAGGTPQGTPLLLLAIGCATVGAATSAPATEHRRAEIVVLVGALGSAQVVGHLILAVAEHHGTHSVAPSIPMLVAHATSTVALAVLISLSEFLSQVCRSVLCWLRLVAIHRSRPVEAALRDALNPWITPVGSAVFAILPGAAKGEYLGEQLLS